MIIFSNKLKRFVYADTLESESSTPLRKNASLIPFLSETLKIEDGVTFGEFFDGIITNWIEYEHVFSSVLSGYSLEPFYKEWNNPPKPDNFASGMSRVEVYWDSNEIDVNNPDEEIFSGAGFHGWGKWDNSDNTVSDEFGGFALEFSPINELKKFPFKLNTLFTLYTYKEGKLPDKLISFKREFTVYDVLSAIFYEISFMGDPTYRDESFENIKQTADELKDRIKDDVDALNPNEIKFDSDGNLLIGNETLRQWLNKTISDVDGNVNTDDKKSTTNLYDLLKKYNIDKPESTDE